AAQARGQPARPKIALIAHTGDPAESLIFADLSILGFDVVTVPEDDAQPTRRNLEQAARRLGAIAAIRITPLRQGAELGIFDRVTGKTVLRAVRFDEERQASSNLPAEALVSMRVVELLRASLLEIEAAQRPRGELPPPPEAKRLVASAVRRPTS